MSPRGRWRSAVTVVVVAAATLVASACSNQLTDTARVSLDDRELIVEVADSMEEQTRGLSTRPQPGDGEGMLFVWDDAAPRSFTISSVRYDIDVIFIGEDERVDEVLTISPDGPEWAEGAYPSRYVIEVRGGWAERYGIDAGSEFSILRGDS